MKEKTTYNPQDIEDLLLNKSFDELKTDEKEFVLSQVKNETEYKELRNTLISVKQIAAEQESVYVPNKIKKDLMQLMKKKKKPFGWFSLNSIGRFLFPSDTPLFRKPGLQLATLALLLLLVVNIGFDFVNQPKNELAINTNKKAEIKEPIQQEKNNQEPKKEVKVLKNNAIEDEEITNNNELKTPPVPLEEVIAVQDKKGYFDVTDSKLAEVVTKPEIVEEIAADDLLEESKSVVTPAVEVGRNKADAFEVKELDDAEFALNKDVRLEDVRVTSTTLGNTDRVVSLKTVTIQSKKSKLVSPQLESQSLEDNSDVIDLLFVTL